MPIPPKMFHPGTRTTIIIASFRKLFLILASIVTVSLGFLPNYLTTNTRGGFSSSIHPTNVILLQNSIPGSIFLTFPRHPHPLNNHVAYQMSKPPSQTSLPCLTHISTCPLGINEPVCPFIQIFSYVYILNPSHEHHHSYLTPIQHFYVHLITKKFLLYIIIIPQIYPLSITITTSSGQGFLISLAVCHNKFTISLLPPRLACLQARPASISPST